MPTPEISDEHAYLRRVTLPFLLPTGVYGAMLVIWHLRPPLQMRFPLHKGRARDYVRFLAWCATEGRREYAILRSIPEWDRELAQPLALPSLAGDDWEGMITVAMFFYGVAHCRYTFAGMLQRAHVRDDIVRAFWRGERHRRHAPQIAPWLRQALVKKFSSIEGLVIAIRIPKHDRKKSDLQLFRRFHLRDVENIESDPYGRGVDPQSDHHPIVAHLPKGLTRSPVRMPRAMLPTLSFVESMNLRPSEFQLSTVTRLVPTDRRQIAKQELGFGVNLYGYARGELGIGEDVRLVAKALESQGIPFCIVNVEPGSEISQADGTAEQWIVDSPHYAINLLCITGVESARFTCERGIGMFGGRYNIGLSPWELPHWPSSCQYTYGAVDEIWGISAYTAHAYRNAPHPVRAMTLPVMVGDVAVRSRGDFGLPEKPYLFFSALDINSSIARKNPAGVIKAFQKAFPTEGPNEVGLVLKVNVSNPQVEKLGMIDRFGYYLGKESAWNSVRRLASSDRRIHLIEHSMRKPEVMALHGACDCYVSLHRAEGFGRCIAEAMLMGKQVVATGFSGNMDFCHEPRVAVVRHRLRAITPGEYFWGDGQVWAEPDLDHAAELMRGVWENPRTIPEIGHDFSPEAVGRIYAGRLGEIREGLGI